MNCESYIGTAGWSVPNDLKETISPEGSGLERYARLYNAVEINSSFYRHHKPETYERWAMTTPANFRFSIKLTKIITHENRLIDPASELDHVLPGLFELKSKLGCLLVQLPPSLQFQADVAREFFFELRSRYEGPVAFEPRHETWGVEEALMVQDEYQIDRVFADPQKFHFPQRPSAGLKYLRLHGSPEIYRSAYTDEALKTYAQILKETQEAGDTTWCIFDNTMFGHASRDALKLRNLLAPSKGTDLALVNRRSLGNGTLGQIS